MGTGLFNKRDTGAATRPKRVAKAGDKLEPSSAATNDNNAMALATRHGCVAEIVRHRAFHSLESHQ